MTNLSIYDKQSPGRRKAQISSRLGLFAESHKNAWERSLKESIRYTETRPPQYIHGRIMGNQTRELY